MNKALSELKIKAKRLLKMIKAGDEHANQRVKKTNPNLSKDTTEIKLNHCQHTIARELGFPDWYSLQSLLTGRSDKVGYGSLFYTRNQTASLNKWFTNYDEAKEFLDSNQLLYPYKNQFVVVEKSTFESVLGLPKGLISKVEGNLVASYPSKEWDEIAYFCVFGHFPI